MSVPLAAKLVDKIIVPSVISLFKKNDSFLFSLSL